MFINVVVVGAVQIYIASKLLCTQYLGTALTVVQNGHFFYPSYFYFPLSSLLMI